MTAARVHAQLADLGENGGTGVNSAVNSAASSAVDPGAEAAVDMLCRGFAEVLHRAPRVPGRVSLRYGDASLEVEWANEVQVVPGHMVAGQAVQAVAAAEPEPAVPAGHTVTAPLVGTFYRAPEPGAAPFVSVGDRVEQGQQVAIVEAMKLLNPIVADQRGRVIEVLVDDAQPVEYGQPLLVLEREEE